MTNDARFPDWEQLYREKDGAELPWFYEPLDPDLEVALAARGLTRGRVLDLGTGPGTQAIALAKRGFDVTGTDIAVAAVQRARARAAAEGAAVTFLVDDALAMTVEGPFDFVFDRGCLHVLPPDRRPTYVENVRRVLRTGGHLFLKCFSGEMPGDYGPHRFTADDVRRTFEGAFAVESIEPATYQGQLPQTLHALFCSLRAQ